MPQRHADPATLPAVFHALADPTRLAVVERLSIGPASATELHRPFDMALTSFMQHLGVLAAAGIVTSHKSGRTRTFQLAPGALAAATDWLVTFRNHWERRLDQLDRVLLGDDPASARTATTTTTTTTTGSTTQEQP